MGQNVLNSASLFFSVSHTIHVNKSTILILFLEEQIIILEWFLKDHVTLKTGVIMLKIQL